MVAGAEMAATVTGRGGLDSDAQVALVSALSDRPVAQPQVSTNNIRAMNEEMSDARLRDANDPGAVRRVEE